MYGKLKENSVESKRQLDEFIKFYNPKGKGKRVLIAGNSITLHGPKKEIGWHGNWGMAASRQDSDYVHILMDKFLKEDTDCVFCVCQVSFWERTVFDGEDCLYLYNEAREFKADVIVARFVENCPLAGFDEEVFKREYTKFTDYLNPWGNAQIIFTSSFWRHPADEVIKEVAAQKKGAYVYLGDLGENDEMQALGLFEHKGVSIHPGDRGMKEIARRIWGAKL